MPDAFPCIMCAKIYWLFSMPKCKYIRLHICINLLRTSCSAFSFFSYFPNRDIFFLRFQSSPVLLRQEHHDQGSRQALRLQIRLSRPHAGLPDPGSRGHGLQVPQRRLLGPVLGCRCFLLPPVHQTKRAAQPIQPPPPLTGN